MARLDAVFETRFDTVVADFDNQIVSYGGIVDAVEHLETTLGGAHRDEQRLERATYTSPDGGELVIDRKAGELRLLLGRATPSRLFQKAAALVAALGGAARLVALEDHGQ